tara:strand:- start:49 stop:270 length:222 start_codon:yes stop_codon:yes gene_type:complete
MTYSQSANPNATNSELDAKQIITNEDKMRMIRVTNDELYEFVKLYDLLRDMDFELTENQTNVFDKILEMEVQS